MASDDAENGREREIQQRIEETRLEQKPRPPQTPVEPKPEAKVALSWADICRGV